MHQSVLNRARLDKFTLVLDLPIALKRTADPILETLPNANTIQFTCFGSPTPSIEVPSIDTPFGGQTLKVSSHSRPAYRPLRLSFKVDNGYKNWWILWRWMDLFNQSLKSTSEITSVVLNGSKPVHPVTDYLTTFTTFAAEEYNRNIMSFVYYGARIVSLSEISYSHQDANEITCQAMFDFNQFNAKLLSDIDHC